uniref:Uncharacterized protein n=1 Tax=Hyaloperonospora arabidopsidis (strain Emoy2) TaxID=559515 RepID=M4B9P8_HYAAE
MCDGAALGGKPVVAVDGHATTGVNQLKKMSAVPATALNKMLAMLEDLSDRIGRMESTQAGQVNCKSKDSENLSSFGGRFWVREQV